MTEWVLKGWPERIKVISLLSKITRSKPRIFLSYSTKHVDVVEGHLAILKPIADVYFANQSLVGGDKIKPALARQIKRAQSFYLFWCGHASNSEWISWEIEQAIERPSMRIVAILLDRTRLPDSISDRLHVDNFVGACPPDDLAEKMGWNPEKHRLPNGRRAHGWDGGFPDRKTFDCYLKLKQNAETKIRQAIDWVAEDLSLGRYRGNAT